MLILPGTTRKIIRQIHNGARTSERERTRLALAHAYTQAHRPASNTRTGACGKDRMRTGTPTEKSNAHASTCVWLASCRSRTYGDAVVAAAPSVVAAASSPPPQPCIAKSPENPRTK